MKTVGLITEYNPFHNGHAYHIRQARALTHADYVIAVMSGDYVQRGEPAIVNKYTRAAMALQSGADLVLELPVRYATGSAEYFGAGAVSLLDSLGVVDALCFGSECGDTSVLLSIAEILAQEPSSLSKQLRQNVKGGMTYPAARASALTSYLHMQLPGFSLSDAFLSSPNNILGVEYCKALLRLHSSITPVAILRVGSSYHQKSLEEIYSSATALREKLYQGEPKEIQNQIPPRAFRLLEESLLNQPPALLDDYSLLLSYRLMQETAESLTGYQDVSPELANRILSCQGSQSSYTDFIQTVKTRELTYTRVSRALLHILLNIRSFPLDHEGTSLVPYARILGFRKTCTPLLGAIKERGRIPLISKLANREKLLSDQSLAMLDEDIWCANLYERVAAHKSDRAFIHETSRQFPIV